MVAEGNTNNDWDERLLRQRDTMKIEFDQFEKDAEFLHSNWLDLRSTHPDKWVAVFREAVVATGWSFEEVIHELVEKKVPRARAVIDYVRADPIPLIL